LVAVFTGDGTYRQIEKSHTANLNLVQCHRSINYIAEMMCVKYGINWLKVNFVGIGATVQSLRDIALYFGDEALQKRTEEVIAEELAAIDAEKQMYGEKLAGKTAAIYVGGSRSHHYRALLADFGVKTVLAGYEFAHRDDYEGRQVIPNIKEDADNKNIEHLSMTKDDKKYRSYWGEKEYEALKGKIALEEYGGIIQDMADGDYIVDDLNHYETEAFLSLLKPDFFFSGIKDKYVLQKAGAISRQLHSYDYSGPYAGFRGAINFAHDLVMDYYAPAWRLVTPPWRAKGQGGEHDA
jgi:nitrogenase molybdenum-iron protein alpha chain